MQRLLKSHGYRVLKELNYDSTVFLAKYLKTDKNVLIKHFDNPIHAGKEYMFSNYLASVANVRATSKLIQNDENTLAIAPFLDGPDLYDYSQTATEEKILSTIHSLIPTVKKLQDNKIVHLDIKGENFVWCTQTQLWHLIDFENA